MIATLISPVEVIARGQFDNNFDPNLVEPFISVAEYRHLASITSIFGKPFYDALLADALSFTNYDSTVVYALNDVVIYGGKYYKRTLVGAAGILPTVTASWTSINKFSTTAYQKLWDQHLWRYLALAVQHSSTYRNAYRSTAKGIMRNKSEFADSAAYAEVKGLKDELMADIDMMREAMDVFLRADKTNYSLYKGNKDCSVQKEASRISLNVHKKPIDPTCPC